MLRNFTFTLVIVFVALLSIEGNLSTAQADVLDFETDTTWRAIGPIGNNEFTGITALGGAWEASNVGWNNSLLYDDSDSNGWTDAIFNGHSNIPNSIWPSGDSFTGPTPAYFRKVFNIAGNPTAGSVSVRLDDDIQLYINGNLIINDTDGLADDFNNINLMPHLTSGLNLIAAKAHDRQGTEGFFGDVSITFDPVPEPSSFALIALGLAGLAVYGGRSRYRSRK